MGGIASGGHGRLLSTTHSGISSLTDVAIFGNIILTTMRTRQISWIKAAKRNFEAFPQSARDRVLDALTIIAAGGMPGWAKPLKGFGAGVLELALRHQGDAYRVVYALQIGTDIWIVHAFQKKSKTGIKTPKAETSLVAQRLKRLKELLG